MAKPEMNEEMAWKEARSNKAQAENWKSSVALNAIHHSIQVKTSLARECIDQIVGMADLITKALREGRKVAFFGNGGSAADAQHITAELVGKFAAVRPPLRALAFTTNSSILTAIGNDFAFDEIFARQVAAQIDRGDVVVGISTSGRSKNVINGVIQARKMGAKTVALTGSSGGQLGEHCDHQVRVPSSDTQRIQECHIMIGHIVCGLIEAELGESSPSN